MAIASNSFTGFPRKTLTFLRNVRRNNTRAWFEQNRANYESCYVEPAIAFVTALSTGLTKIAPVQVEPRINGSIRRIHRDTRFSSDKSPLKDHLDFSFWEGERNKGMSSFFVRVSPDTFVVGAGFRGGSSAQLEAFREAVADRKTGRALARVTKELRDLGYEIGGAHYKRMPGGFDADGPAAEFLLHKGLFVADALKAVHSQAPGMVDSCLGYWKVIVPLHRWLTDRVASPG